MNRMTIGCVAVVAIIGSALASEYASSSYVRGISGRATGFFHVEKGQDGRWWAIDPLGRGFYFAGVQSVNFQGCKEFGSELRRYQAVNQERFGEVGDWAEDTAVRLKGWGFNMLGMWCQRELEHRHGLVYARNLELGASVCDPKLDPDLWIDAPLSFCLKFPNVFHPDFAKHCAEIVEAKVLPWKDDPYLVGWYTDNELDWRAGVKHNAFGLYERVKHKPDGHSAKMALVEFLKERGLELTDEVPDSVKADFIELVAERYFKITSDAIRAVDPNHMVLGPRFAGTGGAAQDCVWRVAGKYCDVVAFNCYPKADLDRQMLQAVFQATDPETLEVTFTRLYELTKKPIMITEWSFVALDSGRPSLRGAGQRFRTQAERTVAVELCLRHFLAMPFIVGWNWFRWVDQPPAGTWTPSGRPGEDSNYGLVDEAGQAYPLTDVFARYLKDVSRWRSEPLPPGVDFPAQGVAADAAIRAFAEARASGVVGFMEAEQSYTVDVGRGIKVRGVKGESDALFTVSNGDDLIFRFIPMVALKVAGQVRNICIKEVRSCQWRECETGCVLTLAVSGGDSEVGYGLELSCDFVFGRPGFIAVINSMENQGCKPFVLSRVFLRQQPSFMPLKAKKETISVPNLWKGPKEAAWFSETGDWCGSLSLAPNIVTMRYYLSADGHPHPDCAFRADGDLKVTPGEILRFGQGSWAKFMFGRGSDAEARHALEEGLVP